MSVRRLSNSGVTGSVYKSLIAGITPVASVPTIGSATDIGTGRAYGNAAANVAFTAGTYVGTSYTATSNPGGFSANSATSPITVTGLSSNTAYTFTVTATNGTGTSQASSNSGSVTVTSVPQAPTIGTATDQGDGTTARISFTAGNDGGSSITGYTVTSNPSSLTGTGSVSPIDVTGLASDTAYTFTVTATNAKGTSSASSATSSLTLAATDLGSLYPIRSYVVPSGGAATIDFTSIPSTYSHLQIRWVARGSSSGSTQGAISMRVGNSSVDTGSNYTWHGIEGNGTNVSTGAGTSLSYTTLGTIPRDGYTSGMMGTGIIDIFNYTSTSKYKTFRCLSGNDVNNTGTDKGEVSLYSGLWLSTSAIDTIKLSVSGFTQSFAQYSSFALYGVKA